MLLTDILDKLIEVWLVHEWKDRHFKGSNERWEDEVSSLFILSSHSEAVLEDTVNNSANTK